MKQLYLLILFCSNLLFSAAPPEYGINQSPILPQGVEFIEEFPINDAQGNIRSPVYLFVFKYGEAEILVMVCHKNVYNGIKSNNRLEGLDDIIKCINYYVWRRVPEIFPKGFIMNNPMPADR